MKYLYSLLVACLCFTACNDEDLSVDPTILPEATSEGRGTLGCVVDNWIYTGGRYGKPTANYYLDHTTGRDSLVISARVDDEKLFSFTIYAPREKGTSLFVDACLGRDSLGRGQAYISTLRNGVVSGTFGNERIKDGRFDLNYTEIQ